MKKILSLALVALMLGVSFVSCNKNGENNKLEATPESDSVATTLGELVGSIVVMQQKQDSAFNKAAFMKGFNAVLKGDTSAYYMSGMQMAMQVIAQAQQLEQQGVKSDIAKFAKNFETASKADSVDEVKMQGLQGTFQSCASRAVDNAAKKKAEPNKKKGADFIAKKLKAGGYTKTASGIIYKVLAPGEGKNFTDEDVVLTKYVGKHIDGKEFDNSKGEAVPFRLNGVVPGFAEMIKLMKPGMKVEVIIPSELAYGDRGQGAIEGGETLVFEMETTGVQPKEAKPAPGKINMPIGK